MIKQKFVIITGICCVLLSHLQLGADVGPVEHGIEQFEAGDLIAARKTLEGALEGA